MLADQQGWRRIVAFSLVTHRRRSPCLSLAAASAEPTAMRARRFAKSLQYKSGAVQRWAAMRLLEFMLIFELVALRILVIGTTVRLCTPCAHPCHICTGTGRTAIAPALIGACAHYGTRK